MLDEKKVNKAIEVFCVNPYWRRYYKEAPTEVCKQRVALDFCYSLYREPESKALYEALEAQFGLEDWKHMLRFCGNNPLRTKYRKKVEEYCNGKGNTDL